MTPARIVKKAWAKKLNIIGICDHNSAENVTAAVNAARNSSLKVLAGMEITSREEIHIIALFDNTANVLALQKYIYRNLQPGKNDPRAIGEQIVANEFDEVVAFNNRLLIAATRLALSAIIHRIHDLKGIAIASHVDRPSYSIIGQLGFIPEHSMLDALEISERISPQRACNKYPMIKDFSLITSSDAHFLNDVGRATTTFLLAEPTVTEIKKAFKGDNGRTIAYD